MKPIEFEGQNVVYAKDQPEYLPLPAHVTKDGDAIHCWELSPQDLLIVMQAGKIWVRQSTFKQPLQPIALSAEPLMTNQPGYEETEDPQNELLDSRNEMVHALRCIALEVDKSIADDLTETVMRYVEKLELVVRAKK